MATRRERGFWRRKSSEIVARVMKDWCDKNGLKPWEPMQPSQAKSLVKAIEEEYPFGRRSNHPYKIWRSVVNESKAAIQIAPPKQAKTRREYTQKHSISPGQINLFGY